MTMSIMQSLALAVLVVGLQGCGGGEDADTTTAPATTAPGTTLAPAPTPGLLLPADCDEQVRFVNRWRPDCDDLFPKPTPGKDSCACLSSTNVSSEMSKFEDECSSNAAWAELYLQTLQTVNRHCAVPVPPECQADIDLATPPSPVTIYKCNSGNNNNTCQCLQSVIDDYEENKATCQYFAMWSAHFTEYKDKHQLICLLPDECTTDMDAIDDAGDCRSPDREARCSCLNTTADEFSESQATCESFKVWKRTHDDIIHRLSRCNMPAECDADLKYYDEHYFRWSCAGDTECPCMRGIADEFDGSKESCESIPTWKETYDSFMKEWTDLEPRCPIDF